MTHLCIFIMLVKGKKEDIISFHKALNKEGDIWIGKGADTEISFESDTVAYITGSCKWSMNSALVVCSLAARDELKLWTDSGLENLTMFDACERFNIVMEAFSKERDFNFQEHCICDKGMVIRSETAVWFETETEGQKKEDIERKFGIQISDEEWEAAKEDGYFSRGGFDGKFTI